MGLQSDGSQIASRLAIEIGRSREIATDSPLTGELILEQTAVKIKGAARWQEVYFSFALTRPTSTLSMFVCRANSSGRIAAEAMDASGRPGRTGRPVDHRGIAASYALKSVFHLVAKSSKYLVATGRQH